MEAPKMYNQRLVHLLQNPTGTDWHRLSLMGIGGAMMVALLFLRRSFFWWRLHPIGFLTANYWYMWNIWFSIFLGSIAKGIIVKQGGLRSYRTARPIFLGMVFGDALMAGVFSIVALLTKGVAYNLLPI
jgi:hypothetical protein